MSLARFSKNITVRARWKIPATFEWAGNVVNADSASNPQNYIMTV